MTNTSCDPHRSKRRVSLSDATETPEALPFDLSVEVTDPWISAESTATLTATITNTGDDARMFSQAFRKGRSGTNGREGILLFSTNAPEAPPEDYAPPCLRGASPTEYERQIVGPRGSVTFTMEGTIFELQPGESRTDTLLVVDDPTVDGCVLPGTYTFEESHTRTPVTRAELDSGAERSDPGSFVWSFTLVVEDVEE